MSTSTILLVLLLIVIIVAVVLILKKLNAGSDLQNVAVLQTKLDEMQLQLNRKEAELARLNMVEKEMPRLQERADGLQRSKIELEKQKHEAEAKLTEETNVRIHAQAELKSLNEKLNTQKQEIEDLQQRFKLEFENVANRILKENTQSFTESSNKNLEDILNPLRDKIQTFEKKVEDTYEKGLKDQTDLRAELKKLSELNHKISDEAHNLTKAIKGDVKKQGNWGEMILEKVLERSGLTEGVEYSKQFSTKNADGKRYQPDVVINLPHNNKHIIIDAKVSLVAYERWANATEEEAQTQFKKEHVASLKSHIKELSDKEYFKLNEIDSPEFVLLFVPIESSFSVAIEADKDIFAYAWERKVVVVSPSTLLATLLTISSVWNREKQTKNAIEIAKLSGAMYDKFVGFVDDMENIGRSIDKSKASYDGAMNKLSEGRGNLVRTSERLKEMGAKASKQLPTKLLD